MTTSAEPTPRRVVGAAIKTNPLVAAAAGFDGEYLADLEDEIAAAERYLAGLRAVHAVATAAGREPDDGPATPKALASRAEAPPADPPPPPKPDGGTITDAIRKLYADDNDAKTADVVDAVCKLFPAAKRTSVQAQVYNTKTRMRSAGQLPASRTPARPTPAEPAGGATADDGTAGDDEDDAGVGGATKPEKDRAVVVEFVFKKGLADVPTIIAGTGLAAVDVGLSLTHTWFERAADKWRLSAAGRREGVKL